MAEKENGWRAWALHATVGVLVFIASVTITLAGFIYANTSQRIDRLETIVDARGERIAILETHSAQMQTELERIRDLLDLIQRYQADSTP